MTIKRQKIRYLKQRDQFRCGPIAIINVLKWAGLPATYKTIDLFSIIMRTNENKGTKRLEITKALKLFDPVIKFKHKNKPTSDDIRNHLDSNRIALVLIRWIDEKKKAHGHYFVIDRVSNNNFNCINYSEDLLTESPISLDSMDVILHIIAKGRTSKAWLIEKR